MHTTPSIVVSDVTFGFDPFAEPLLTGLNATIPPGRTGIVGRNGSGKTTLLRLLAGELSPTGGTIKVPGRVARIRQDLLQRPASTVAELLGIADTLAALRRIEAGSIDPSHFDAVGDGWDVEARATALLARRIPCLAVDGALDRTAVTLSGGELMLVAMCGLELTAAQVSILDEPSNNLDTRARAALHEAVREWRGTLLVVSHDVSLLNLMDSTLELHDGALTVYGGNYDSWIAHLATQQAAAAQAVRAAEHHLRTERRERDHVQTVLARREQKSRKDYANKRAPRITMKAWAEKSEKSRAAEANQAAAKVAQASQAMTEAEQRVREDRSIRVDIVDPRTARGRRLAELVGTNRTVYLTGGHRLAIVGDNGVGKTSLLRTLLHGQPTHLPARGRLLTRRYGYLDQRLELPDDATVLDAIREGAPERPPHEVRGGLAKFLLRGDMVERQVSSLSGGERFRVALARLLLAEPPPELLVLDEPTNNLDLDSVDQLVEGLRAYRGALLVVSHDAHLLERLQLDEVVELLAGGVLQ